MKQIVLDQFARKGLNSDLAPSILDGDFFTYAENIRIYDGAIHPFGGYSEVSDVPNNDTGKLYYIASKSGNYIIMMGLTKILHHTGGSHFVEKQPYGMTVTDTDLWSATSLGEIPIINHPNVGPYYYDYPTATYKSLPWKSGKSWSQAQKTCTIIRSHKQYLFALGLSENAVEMPDAVRWSAPADIGSIPPTWDETDLTNFAGITTLGGDGGAIIDGLSLRDSFVVYRERSISIFDYVGGQYVWRIRHLSQSAGLLSRECIVEANGSHYFIGKGDVYRNDGTTLRSIMHDRIKKQFSLDLNPKAYQRSYAIHYIIKSELWFCIPTGSSEYADKAYIYNYLDDSWAVREIPKSLNAIYGAPAASDDQWDQMTKSWQDTSRAWNQQSDTPYTNTLLTVAKGTPDKLVGLDSSIGSTAEPFSSIIERTEFALEGVNNVTTINKVYPHVTGTGKLKIQFGSQQNAGGPTTWKLPVEFDPRSDRKIDLRSTGELHCYRIYSDEVKADYAFVGMTIEYVEAGKR